MSRLTLRRVAFAVLAVAGLLLLYDSAVNIRGIGSLAYGVRIVSSVPIREVRFMSISSPEGVEEAIHLNSVDRREPVRPEEWDGNTLYASVTFYFRESGLRWRDSYRQHRYLLIVAVLVDGQRVRKVVELPDAAESREVTVRLG